MGIEIASVVATGAAIANSLYLIRCHMRWNRHPVLLTCTVRILLMVPVYSLVSCVGLWVHGTAFEVELCEVIRSVYEAVILFSFLQFIVASAGGPRQLVARFQAREGLVSIDNPDLEAPNPELPATSEGPAQQSNNDGSSCATKGSRRAQHFPLLNRCLPPWASAGQMLRWCVRGTLLYVVVGAMYAVSHFLILAMTMLGHEDFFGKKTLGSSIKVAMIVSQALGMTCLVTLAVNMLEDLEHLRPRAKFLSVKLVVAFCFWQELIFLVLRSSGVFRPLIDVEHRWTSDQEISQGLQHLLICFEMFAASVYHSRVFPPHDYLNILAHLHAAEEKVDLAPVPRWKGAAVVSPLDIVATVQSVKKNVLGDPRPEDRPARVAIAPLGAAGPAAGGAHGAEDNLSIEAYREDLVRLSLPADGAGDTAASTQKLSELEAGETECRL